MIESGGAYYCERNFGIVVLCVVCEWTLIQCSYYLSDGDIFGEKIISLSPIKAHPHIPEKRTIMIHDIECLKTV